jgi:hypothetical protein
MRNSDPMFEPENELEAALVAAATDVNRRQTFLPLLIEAQVFVAFAADREFESRPDGTATIPAGTRLNPRLITRNGITHLPFFSAASRARAMFTDSHIILPDTTRAMFERYPGSPFVLNPGSDYGRDFPAAEVARLLAGDFGASHNTVIVTEPAKVLLSQPLPYPVALTEVLKPVFAAQASVEAAYLAQADFQNGDRHPVIALKLADAGWRATMNAMQLDLKRALADRGLVDFVPYQGGPFDDYFSDVAPFYRRAAARTGWRRWLSGS